MVHCEKHACLNIISVSYYTLQGRARLQAATVTVGETPAMSPGNMFVKETYHYTIYNTNTANS